MTLAQTATLARPTSDPTGHSAEWPNVTGHEAASLPIPAGDPRVSERDLAYAIAAWLDGADFSPVSFRPYVGLRLGMRATGDILLARTTGVRPHEAREAPVLDRITRSLIATPEGLNSAELHDARAVCRYVLNGEYKIMWGRRT